MSEIVEKDPNASDSPLVRVRQKTVNAQDVTLSRVYAESLGDEVEILDAEAVDSRGQALEPTKKSETPKRSAAS